MNIRYVKTIFLFLRLINSNKIVTKNKSTAFDSPSDKADKSNARSVELSQMLVVKQLIYETATEGVIRSKSDIIKLAIKLTYAPWCTTVLCYEL